MFFNLWKLGSGLFLQADPGGGTGTEPGGAADPAKAKADTEPADPKPGDDAKDKKPVKIVWTEDQQAEINRLMGETRKEERKKAKAESDAEVAKAKKEAEDKELQDKEQFKELAANRLTEIEQLKTQVQDLTSAKEQGDKYKAALEAHLKAQIEKLPAHIKSLLAKLDVLEQMEFLTKNAKDLGVKLGPVDPTPPEKSETDADLLSTQHKDIVRQVRSYT